MHRQSPKSIQSQNHGAKGGPAGHVEETGAAGHHHAREERGEERLHGVRLDPGKVGVGPEDLQDVIVGLEDDLPLDVEDKVRVEDAFRVNHPLRV